MENEIKLEKALDQLEKIVGDLESGDLTIDEALKHYEEGVKLSKACLKRLNEAEKKIEMLTRTLNEAGEVHLEGAETGEDLRKSSKKKAKKVSPGNESDPDLEFLL